MRKDVECEEQARSFAQGVEQAAAALGARHQLREALRAGHELGLRRCWAAISERGWESETLGAGKSETLAAALLGADPVCSLKFLFEIVFEPGAKAASMALLSALAPRSIPVAAAALESLCRDFRAGTLSPPVIAELERRSRGLGELARSRGEAYELDMEFRPAATPSPAPARRL